uniref:Ig-like domain-containing protein n=1 Tax=Seriola lalandi dorsalis TaxID=1841481 RepID=A0A3B4WWM8_SERLL
QPPSSRAVVLLTAQRDRGSFKELGAAGTHRQTSCESEITFYSPKDTNIIVVEWSRPGLEPEHVFLYRGGRCVTSYQHLSFQNRVELQDRQMKDGDVSLILKNVKEEDTGNYKCRVIQGGRNRRKRDTSRIETISIIHLDVHQPGESVDNV